MNQTHPNVEDATTPQNSSSAASSGTAPQSGSRPAGFWARFAALGIDVGLVSLPTTLVTELAGGRGLYVPWELTVIVSLTIYSTVMLCWKGATVGKLLCGITVCAKTGSRLSWWRVLLRESVAKAVSAIALFLGFARVALIRDKRALHDLLAGTRAFQGCTAVRRTRWILVVELLLVAGWSLNPLLTGLNALRMARHGTIAQQHLQRDASRLVEVTSLGPSNTATFVEWVDAQGQDPAEYVLGVAASHQLTLIGECHDVRENLTFLNRLIPELYHRSGVTCLALETCLAEDNPRLQKLVTADRFDPALALTLARRGPWACWGGKEYWDILKTVWALNQGLPEGKPRLRVVGLNCRWDGPSLALARSGPPSERLRLWRVLGELPLMFLGIDHIYARNVEKETFEKGAKGVVWVGGAHTPLHGAGQPRLGALLFHKHRERVFQVRLHESDQGRTSVGSLVEAVMARRGHAPVGFTVAGSPFAVLRDSRSGNWNSMFDYRHPQVAFEDLAAGYVYLAPVAQQTPCQWMDGYISIQMFGRNKPFYEMAAGQKLANADAANRVGREKGFNF